MTEKEFVSKIESSCSIEELLQCKGQLLLSSIVEEEVLDELFATLVNTNQSSFDRASFMTALVNFICTTGDSVPFIMNLFKELLRKDGCTEEAIDYAVNVAYRQARNAREIKIQKRICEKKQIRREKLRQEEEQLKRKRLLKELEKTIDMSKTCVSYDTARFLVRNGTTYEEMASKVNLQIVSQAEIDSVLFGFRIDSEEKEEMVSIADVIGYDYSWIHCGNDLLKAFPSFFDSNRKDGYHQRALSMLDLTVEDVMEKLAPSFLEEPMKLVNTLDGKYTVGGNGMHRYSVLRSLFCIEMMRAKGDKEKEHAIYEKYKIPVVVSKIDVAKTFANYVLTTLKLADWVWKEKDSRGYFTGKTEIIFSNHENLILTDEELLHYVGDVLRNNKECSNVVHMIENAKGNFLRFLSSIVPEMIENVSYLEVENERTM